MFSGGFGKKKVLTSQVLELLKETLFPCDELIRDLIQPYLKLQKLIASKEELIWM